MSRPAHAIVLGGGWAGMLAAHALSRHLDTVTVVERDTLPDGPEHRKGLPQARHCHLLWSGGARIVEELLPGALDRLDAAGARRIGVHKDLVTLTAHGWQHRFEAAQYAVMVSRPMLDFVIREQIMALGRVLLRQGVEAVRLLGDARRITGAEVRTVHDGTTEELTADLVVDATGRGSRLRHWLAALDVPPIDEDIVDVGIGYVTRIFQAPEGASTGFPALNVLGDYRVREPGCNGAVYPIEDGRWIVTLSGTRGATLPATDADFLPFARSLRDPLVADVLERAEPLTGVFTSRIGINRRLYPERLEAWPDGLLAFGDSLAAFNPIYGHGLSASARGAAVLDGHLRRGEWRIRDVQRAVSTAVDDAWIMATSRDICYVNCRNLARDPRLTGGALSRQRFTEALAVKAIRAPRVSEVVTDVTSLAVPQAELGTSRFLTLMQQDPLLPELTGPPLDRDELALVNLVPRGAVAAAPRL
ncbi:NAD(P)/FAD-dependent oxidoreductase [Phytohabitans houttuyneae]|uniref:FAD-dependent oxidoreductase n=1 Tax=Phytohabitans houttuyneae TaxID=1076126 RepID=A0A6V8KEC8_9ACTN|nr:FAD-dependent oxidoreductase [Phytohabitans houttuyneae]GFJ80791.1 hypothetical protein Phou_049710 [Phytohabitans houttuyneae]